MDKPIQAFDFDAIRTVYEDNPTIENFVRLRRNYPDVPLSIGTTGHIEFLFKMADELEELGIDPSVVEAAMEANRAAQGELSLVLLELIIERQKRQKAGETHLVSRNEVISDSLVNYLIAVCLDSLDENCLKMTPELTVLIKHQLGPISSRYEEEEEKRQKKDEALWIAIQLAGNGETPSYRKIAHAMGVKATTVMRWFPDDSFISTAKTFVGKVHGVIPPVDLTPTTRRRVFGVPNKRTDSADRG